MQQNLKASQHKGKVEICLAVISMPQKDIGVIIHTTLCMSVAATACEQISVIAQSLNLKEEAFNMSLLQSQKKILRRVSKVMVNNCSLYL